MSTTFGIHKRGKLIPLIDDMLTDDFSHSEFVEVAFRGNGGRMRWMTEDIGVLCSVMADDIRVYPLDNTAQGVYSLGDIKKEIKTETDKAK